MPFLGVRTGVPMGGMGGASSAWINSGAVIDLDFLNGRYFGGQPSDLIANTNSTGGFAVNANSLTLVGANLPRIGSGVGLLAEASGTNVTTFSSDFSNATWSKNGIGTGVAPTVTTAFATAPDGTMTANRVQFNLGATPGTAFSRIFGTATEGSICVNSVWFKSNDSQNHIIYLIAVSGSRIPILVTPTWQQFSRLLNAALAVEFGLSGAAGTDTTADILAWGADLEIGVPAAGTPLRPTSTISTTSASVTRFADSLAFAGAAVAAAVAGKSTVRYIDNATGLLIATNFAANAFAFPANAIIQRITIYNPATTPGVGANATIYWNGNSLTVGTNATSRQTWYPTQVLLSLAKSGYSIADHIVGVSGQTTPQMNTLAASGTDPNVSGSTAPFIDVFWEITNDILTNNVSGATAYANYVTFAQARRVSMRAGDKLVALTCMARGAAVGWTGANETARLAANALILANTTDWDAVVDVTTITQLQDPTNKTYFEQTNQTHLTDLGYQLLAAAVLPVIQGLLPHLP